MSTRLLERPTVVPDVFDDLTRRQLLVGTTALGVLGACSRPAVEDEPAGGAASGFPVTVEHKYGATTINGRAERVVTVGWFDPDPVLALGVQPVGLVTSTSWNGDPPDGVYPWALQQLGQARPEVMPGEINFEKIAALRPDLILGMTSVMSGEDYEKLAKIAPTVADSKKYPDFSTPWQELTRTAGQALGEVDRAERLVAEVEGQFAAARAAHPEFAGATLAYAGIFGPGKYYLDTSTRVRAVVSGLGFVIPQEILDLTAEQFFFEISQERLEVLDHDVLLWEVFENPQARSFIEADPLYQRLDVAREGRAVFAEDKLLVDAMVAGTVLSLPIVIDRLVPMLAAALDEA